MNVFDLFAKLELDSSEYEKGISGAKKSFSGLGSTISSGAKTIGKATVGTFALMGTAVVGSTKALIDNTAATATLADTIDKESQKLGISAEAYQEWDAVLQHTGGSIDSIKPAMKTLAKEAINNSEAFQKLGISQEEVATLSKEEIFARTISALQEMPEGMERTRLATELLGKSSVELGALLNTSAEDTQAMRDRVHELGGVMSDDAVKAGAAFKDSLQDLQTSISGAKNNLMSEFMPSLTTVMDGLTALFTGDDSGIAKIQEGIENLASKLSEKLPKALETVGGIAESLIGALPSFFDAIAQQLPSLFQTLIPVLINALVGLSDAVEKSLPQILSSVESNIGVITSGLTKIITSIGRIILKLTPKILPMLIKVGLELIKALSKGFIENSNEIISAILQTIDLIVKELTNPETLSQLLTCGIQIVLALANGILQNLPTLLGTLGTLLSNVLGFFVTEGIPQILEGAIQLFEAIGDGVGKAWNYITGKLGDLLFDILGTDGIGGWLIDITSKAKEMFEGIGLGIMHAGAWIWEKVTGLGEDILKWIGDGLGDIFDIGKNLVEGLWNGITSVGDWIKEKITGFGNRITGWLKDTLGISSPSKVTAWMGEMLDEGLGEGVEKNAKKTFQDIQNAMDEGMNSISLDPLNADVIGTVDVTPKTTKRDASIDKLVDLVRTNNQKPEVIQLFVGNRLFEELYVDAKRNITTRSGGQVNV